MVIYFSHMIRKKENIRATLLFYFLVLNLWSITTFTFNGLINLVVLTTTALLLPSSILGILIGSRIHRSVNQTLFRRIMAAILLVSGFINMILT